MQIITVKDLKKILEESSNHQYCLIDVRNPEEHLQGIIKNALTIPLPILPLRLSEVPRDKTIYLICRSGGRSGIAAQFLLENGFKKVFNVEGGMLAWEELINENSSESKINEL